MTQPAVDAAQSGSAADAVRTLHSELNSDYSEMRSAEVQLTEAILSAHAVTVAGRAQLQDIQRQLIETINNPAAALDTPAGERQFLMFLRSKIAEIQGIVDAGALTDEDHARLTRALGSGYLLATPERSQAPAPAAAPVADQAAGMVPALGSALGSLPQAAQGAAAAPAQGAGGLAGLASGLLERAGQTGLSEDRTTPEREPDGDADVDEKAEGTEEDDEDDETDGPDEVDTDGPPAAPQPPRESPRSGPAQTRPARLL